MKHDLNASPSSNGPPQPPIHCNIASPDGPEDLAEKIFALDKEKQKELLKLIEGKLKG